MDFTEIELPAIHERDRMKKISFIGLILLFSMSACMSPKLTATRPAQQVLEMTPEDSAMQTIIAREQITSTPTPAVLSNLPQPWTELTTAIMTPESTPYSTFASAIGPFTSILVGAGYNRYRMACYVDQGTELMITGRNIDSTWLMVKFSQGQTCFIMDESHNRTNIIPDPTIQLWVFHSTITISGDLSGVAIITPTP